MSTPVFVIHGIGARDEEEFDVRVAALGRAARLSAPHPVYWGDLGAKYDEIEVTVPGAAGPAAVRDGSDDGTGPEEAIARFLAEGVAPSGAARAEVRDGGVGTVPPRVVDAALGRLQRGDAEVRNDPASAGDVATALEEAWPTTSWLRYVDDPDLLVAVGKAVAAPVDEGAGGDAEVRGLGDVKDFVKRRIADLDAVVGAAFGAAGGRLNSHLRTTLLPGATRLVGDILVYQRHQDLIQQRVRERIARIDPALGDPDHPIDVVAHSLGGVIAFDMAIAKDDPLCVRRLVTFGSQSAFFHVCYPRGGVLEAFDGSGLVRLPPTIGGWTNLWEPLDVVAFIAARVFQLHDGRTPDDRAVPHLASSGVWTHSSYWTLDSVAEAIRDAIGAPATG